MITIPTKGSGYGDGTRVTDAILVFGGSRYRFVYTPHGAESRITTGGPMVPGPHVQAFELATTIAANPEHGTYGEMRRARTAGLVVELAIGDDVDIDGTVFTVAQGVNFRPDYLRFDRAAMPAAHQIGCGCGACQTDRIADAVLAEASGD